MRAHMLAIEVYILSSPYPKAWAYPSSPPAMRVSLLLS